MLTERFVKLISDYNEVHIAARSMNVNGRRAAHQALRGLEREIVRQGLQQTPSAVLDMLTKFEYYRDCVPGSGSPQSHVDTNDYQCRVIRLLKVVLAG